MVDESEVNSGTCHSRVLVLEDEDKTVDELCEALREDGKQVWAAKNLDQFEDYLRSDTFDAGSIDLFINHSFVGPQAMERLKHYEPDAGTLVYSVRADDPKIAQTMRQASVDVMVTKIGNNIPEYLAKVEQAARLGLSRMMVRALRDAGRLPNQHLLPELLNIPLASETEKELYRESRSLAIEHAVAGEEHEIVKVLRRRGWWRLFDSTHFAELSELDQLGQLFEFVGGQPQQLAQILGVEDDVALSLLQGETSAVREDLYQDVGGLISVLDYLLRLSKHEPELMPHYWTVKGLFSQSSTSPPWDRFGMAEYLLENGVIGIREASSWIKRRANDGGHGEQVDAIEKLLDEIKQRPVGGTLRIVRQVIQEESAARRYVTERYRALVDQKYLNGLSSSESDELDRLKSTLDTMDEPYYDAIIRSLRRLVDSK